MVNLKAFPLEIRMRKRIPHHLFGSQHCTEFLVSIAGIENKSTNIKNYLLTCYRHVESWKISINYWNK